MKFLTLLILCLSVVACTPKQERNPLPVPTTQHEDPEGYFTCPMHPQVHTHEPGKCPVCGMTLVKVGGKKVISNPATLQPTNEQLAHSGIGRVTVTRQDLDLKIPVSGRFLSPREVVIQVYEADLAAIRTGAELVGFASTSPGQQLKGRVIRVDNLVDPASRTIRVTAVLDKEPTVFVAEGLFSGAIHILLKNQLSIPEDAVVHTGQRDLVYKIGDNNELQPMPVILGHKATGHYQILSGVNEGDVIASGPNFLLDSEAKIRGSNDQTHH
jgi:multidrug efflux pump subunit AcrA (membrane-fusion protein)